ncbi:MAG: STAS domain-containing protein [Gallionella sp.]|nr:STAS domain-containing protein [Gallionella sp.]
MSVSVQVREGVGRIVMTGRFDFQVHREFKDAYTALLEKPDVREIEVEMSKVDYLDSSALGMLMLLNERAKAAGRAIVLLNTSGVVSQVLEVANFGKIFTIKHAI